MDIIDTSFELSYDLYDMSAVEDSTVTFNSNESFADLSELETGTNYGKVMTLEHNFSCLDGSMSEMVTDPEIAIFSTAVSDEDGYFDINPTITIAFSKPHSIIGFTLDFADERPLNLDIIWYNANNEILKVYHANLAETTNTIRMPMVDFSKVVIEFTRAIPYHRIKLNKITYGIEYVWGEDKIVDAKSVDESSIIADRLSINTMDFSIFDSADDFNLGNPDGLHSYIQNGQVVDSYEYVRGEKIYLGRKFISKFSSQNGLVKFTTQSYLGLMDAIDYHKGDIYNSGIKAGLLIDDLMDTCGITDYEVDQDVYDTIVYGTLKSGTCRNCLREILFATQAMIDTTGISGIKIYRRTKQVRGSVGRDVKISTKVTKKEYISGVAVSYKTYELDSNNGSGEIVSGLYPAGDNLVTWDSPHSSITASAGTIVESGKYYCILRLAQESTVTISGYSYSEHEFTVYKKDAYLEPGQQENIKKFSGTLLNVDLAKTVAEHIYEYYSYVLQLDIKYLADDEKMKHFTLIQNPDSNYNDYIAQYEKITTNLTGGYVSDATLVGYYDLKNSRYYADSELIADDDVIV